LIAVSAINRNLCAFARDGFSQRRKGNVNKIEHEILFRFLHQLSERELEDAKASGLKATKVVARSHHRFFAKSIHL
jgi:hypothetical protein